MPIKKSMVLLLALVTGSVVLLVFSWHTSNICSANAGHATPVKKCCQQSTEIQTLSPRNIITQSMFHLSA